MKASAVVSVQVIVQRPAVLERNVKSFVAVKVSTTVVLVPAAIVALVALPNEEPTVAVTVAVLVPLATVNVTVGALV